MTSNILLTAAMNDTNRHSDNELMSSRQLTIKKF